MADLLHGELKARGLDTSWEWDDCPIVNAGAESQVIIQRCYVHDNPDSNIYLGSGRRANKVLDCVCNYSLTSDGITVAGSDNTIQRNICGSNARAGICLGTTGTQHWAAVSGGNAVAPTLMP